MALDLELEGKVLDMGHELKKQFLEHKKEFAQFTIDRSLEDRVTRLEDMVSRLQADNERKDKQIQVTNIIVVLIVATLYFNH